MLIEHVFNISQRCCWYKNRAFPQHTEHNSAKNYCHHKFFYVEFVLVQNEDLKQLLNFVKIQNYLIRIFCNNSDSSKRISNVLNWKQKETPSFNYILICTCKICADNNICGVWNIMCAQWQLTHVYVMSQLDIRLRYYLYSTVLGISAGIVTK